MVYANKIVRSDMNTIKENSQLLCVGGIMCQDTSNSQELHKMANNMQIKVFKILSEAPHDLPIFTEYILRKAIKPTGYDTRIVTDDRENCIQSSLSLSPHVLNMQEHYPIDGRTIQCDINPFDYTDDQIDSCIGSFGYDSISDMYDLYGKDWYMILCECLFEDYEIIELLSELED